MVSVYTTPTGDLLEEMNRVADKATDKNPAILSVFQQEDY